MVCSCSDGPSFILALLRLQALVLLRIQYLVLSYSDSGDEFELPPPKRIYIILEYSNSKSSKRQDSKKLENFNWLTYNADMDGCYLSSLQAEYNK